MQRKAVIVRNSKVTRTYQPQYACSAWSGGRRILVIINSGLRVGLTVADVTSSDPNPRWFTFSEVVDTKIVVSTPVPTTIMNLLNSKLQMICHVCEISC
jgi:hypothetical protein